VLDAFGKCFQRDLDWRRCGLVGHARLDLVQFEFQWVLPLDQFIQLQQSGLVGIQQPLALLQQQVLPPGVPFGDHRCGLRDGGPGVTDALRLPQEVGERLPDQRFDQITPQRLRVEWDIGRSPFAAVDAGIVADATLRAPLQSVAAHATHQQAPQPIRALAVPGGETGLHRQLLLGRLP
jgi:hypothetical protein